MGYIYNTTRWEKHLEYLETWWGPRDMWSLERSCFALGLIWSELRRGRPKGLFAVEAKPGEAVEFLDDRLPGATVRDVRIAEALKSFD